MKVTFANKPKNHSFLKIREQRLKNEEVYKIVKVFDKIFQLHNEALKIGISLGQYYRLRPHSFDSLAEAERMHEKVKRTFDYLKKLAEQETEAMQIGKLIEKSPWYRKAEKHGGTLRASKMRSSFPFWIVQKRYFRRYWKAFFFHWPKFK